MLRPSCCVDHTCVCVRQGDKFVDRWRYKEMQSEKKKGFLTSDFSKRDEFSHTVRTQQWREQLQVQVVVSAWAVHIEGRFWCCC